MQLLQLNGILRLERCHLRLHVGLVPVSISKLHRHMQGDLLCLGVRCLQLVRLDLVVLLLPLLLQLGKLRLELLAA